MLGDQWRLPTRSELLTLVDEAGHEPATFDAFASDTESGAYWASTPAAWSPSDAWFVGFSIGYASGNHRNYECFVRAVRSVKTGDIHD